MSDRPLRIIYVEGHENLSEVIELALTKIGKFETYGFDDADEALDGAQTIGPDAILIDAAHVNGLASYFLKEVRLLEGCRDIPVVLASERQGVHHIRRFKALGATVVIPGPINPFSLSEIMRDVCAASSPMQGPPADSGATQDAASLQ